MAWRVYKNESPYQMKDEQSSQYIVLEQLDIQKPKNKKMKPHLNPYLIYKNSKRIMDLHVKPETIKPVEDKEFLDLTPRAWPIKGKMNKLDFTKSKKFYTMTLLRDWKHKPHSEGKYLQVTYLTND